MRLVALLFGLMLATSAYLVESSVFRPLLLGVTDGFVLLALVALGPPSTSRLVARIVLRSVAGVGGLMLLVAGLLLAIRWWPSLGFALVGVGAIVAVVLPNEERAVALAVALVGVLFAIGFGVGAFYDDPLAPLGVVGALGLASTSVRAAFARPRVDSVPRAVALA